METKVKKHRFNAVDAVIIIVIAALIAAAVLFFMKGGIGASGDKVKIQYVIEFRTVDSAFADNFTLGDKVTDSVAKYHLGELVAYTAFDAKYTANSLSGGGLTLSTYPDHSDIELTIEAYAAVGAGGRYVLDGGYDLSVGSTVHVRMPNYTGTGYCTHLTEVGA